MRILLVLIISLIGISAYGQQPFPQNVYYHNMGIGITNIAASTTNSTLGEINALNDVKNGATLQASFVTYTNVGSVKIIYIGSPDGTTYTSPQNSMVFLNLSLTNNAATGATTNVIDDWFNLVGYSFIRKAQIQVNAPTSVTNFISNISYPLDANTQNR